MVHSWVVNGHLAIMFCKAKSPGIYIGGVSENVVFSHRVGLLGGYVWWHNKVAGWAIVTTRQLGQVGNCSQ